MPNKQVELVKIKLIPVPKLSFLGGCGMLNYVYVLEPWFKITNGNLEYDSRVR
jgi:phosphatidylinositol-3,4,5-trisphosphate 3-phosphatase/dual-specificity protein phosphatase PTEN